MNRSERLTVGLSGGRMGKTCGALQADYRAASLRADAGRPSAAAGVGPPLIIYPIARYSFKKVIILVQHGSKDQFEWTVS